MTDNLKLVPSHPRWTVEIINRKLTLVFRSTITGNTLFEYSFDEGEDRDLVEDLSETLTLLEEER